MAESSIEVVSKTLKHSSCHWEHTGNIPLKVVEETYSYTITSEKKRQQVRVYLPPIYGDPVFILKQAQEHHASSCFISYLLCELLNKFLDAVTNH